MQFDYYFWNVTNAEAVSSSSLFFCYFLALGFFRFLSLLFVAGQGLESARLFINLDLFSTFLSSLSFSTFKYKFQLQWLQGERPVLKEVGPYAFKVRKNEKRKEKRKKRRDRESAPLTSRSPPDDDDRR